MSIRLSSQEFILSITEANTKLFAINPNAKTLTRLRIEFFTIVTLTVATVSLVTRRFLTQNPIASVTISLIALLILLKTGFLKFDNLFKKESSDTTLTKVSNLLTTLINDLSDKFNSIKEKIKEIEEYKETETSLTTQLGDIKSLMETSLTFNKNYKELDNALETWNNLEDEFKKNSCEYKNIMQDSLKEKFEKINIIDIDMETKLFKMALQKLEEGEDYLKGILAMDESKKLEDENGISKKIEEVITLLDCNSFYEKASQKTCEYVEKKNIELSIQPLEEVKKNVNNEAQKLMKRASEVLCDLVKKDISNKVKNIVKSKHSLSRKIKKLDKIEKHISKYSNYLNEAQTEEIKKVKDAELNNAIKALINDETYKLAKKLDKIIQDCGEINTKSKVSLLAKEGFLVALNNQKTVHILVEFGKQKVFEEDLKNFKEIDLIYEETFQMLEKKNFNFDKKHETEMVNCALKMLTDEGGFWGKIIAGLGHLFCTSKGDSDSDSDSDSEEGKGEETLIKEFNTILDKLKITLNTILQPN